MIPAVNRSAIEILPKLLTLTVAIIVGALLAFVAGKAIGFGARAVGGRTELMVSHWTAWMRDHRIWMVGAGLVLALIAAALIRLRPKVPALIGESDSAQPLVISPVASSSDWRSPVHWPSSRTCC